MSNSSSTPQNTNQLLRFLFFCLGCLCFIIGLVGVVVPVLPTTPLMILAAMCWARSSRHFYTWLITHRVFGVYIRNWEARRAIPRHAKWLAWSMMTLSCAMLFYRLPRQFWWVAVISSLVCLCTAWWMSRLPDA